MILYYSIIWLPYNDLCTCIYSSHGSLKTVIAKNWWFKKVFTNMHIKLLMDYKICLHNIIIVLAIDAMKIVKKRSWRVQDSLCKPNGGQFVHHCCGDWRRICCGWGTWWDSRISPCLSSWHSSAVGHLHSSQVHCDPPSQAIVSQPPIIYIIIIITKV